MNRPVLGVIFTVVISVSAEASAAQAIEEFTLRLSWGHQATARTSYFVKIVPSDVEVVWANPLGFEPGDVFRGGAWQTRAGGGDTDEVELVLRCRQTAIEPVAKLPPTWRDLITQSDPDTAQRLRSDPALRRDRRRLTFQLNPEATRGCSVTVDQLLCAGRLWVPALDLYLDAGREAMPLAKHLAGLKPREGKRILDQVHQEPEATYEQFKRRWEDMGSPAYRHPAQPAPGHIVCLSWDSAVRKFGIDRGAGVWNDYGNPDRFRCWFDFGDGVPAGGSGDMASFWKGQRLADGFPVLTTVFEKEGVRYEVEQFAYPLDGPPAERRGDMPMVLLEKVRVTELSARPRTVSIVLHHQRKVGPNAKLALKLLGERFLLADAAGQQALLLLEGFDTAPTLSGVHDLKDGVKQAALTLSLDLAGHQTREFVVKLPSPPVGSQQRRTLDSLDYAAARAATLRFWADYEARGARFSVPEKAVNELFRANLWHALRLPRRAPAKGGSGGQQPSVRIDLPYSNFAYAQQGSPWPVNQAVYVDYMIYDLRGYHRIAAEELAAMFRNNQQPNGHVQGYANWLVYTPSMLYAVAKNYLLSQDRGTFERLLPMSLKAMDWCLRELRQAKQQPGSVRGLVRGPLNDGTGEGYWAFSQAYLFAGLDLYGRALERIGHPRAQECLAAAGELRLAIDRAFHEAAVRSPLVPLRDGTWIPYVPCEVTPPGGYPGRLMDQWYPTDVDTGAVHLVRLKALPAGGDLAESLLNDHEDNLYLKGWGMANEPVYNPQATAYLLRDDPKAAIRAFYSMMACAFSHSVFEPVEHRWTHGQYFGPPSTDGAWAELYRNMLIQEWDDGTLRLFMATPRKWLEDGNTIDIQRAPTYYGKLSAHLESRAGGGRITADARLPGADRPKALVVRFRHARSLPMRSVRVNGEVWTGLDARKETVRIDNPVAERYTIEAEY
jgi:hypothetical protein